MLWVKSTPQGRRVGSSHEVLPVTVGAKVEQTRAEVAVCKISVPDRALSEEQARLGDSLEESPVG